MITTITYPNDNGVEITQDKDAVIVEALLAFRAQLDAKKDFFTNPSILIRKMFVDQIVGDIKVKQRLWTGLGLIATNSPTKGFRFFKTVARNTWAIMKKPNQPSKEGLNHG